MSGYLQRLFDRAAATAAPVTVSPAGPSHSPIAMADQRLNDPAMLASIAPRGDDGFEGAAAEPVAPAAPPLSTPTDTARGPIPPMRAPRAAAPPPVREAAAKPGRDGDERREPPPAKPVAAAHEPGQRMRSPVPPIGAVLPDDFVPPDPPHTAETPTPPKTEPDRGRSSPAHAVPAQTPSVLSVPDDSPESPAARSETREPPSPVAIAPARKALRAAQPSAEAAATPAAAPEPVLMMPPPVPAPPLPETPPAVSVTERETRREIRTERTRERIELAPDRTPPRPARPMTAAEASLIGPLVPRPRARTFMGVRRR